jgi:protease IV
MKQFLKNVFASCLGVILSFFVIALILSAIIGGMVSSLGEDKKVTVKDNSILVIDLKNEIVDRASDSPFDNFDLGSFSKSSKIGLKTILDNLEKAAEDEKIKGIFIEVNESATGIAVVDEVRKALLRFKESGKFIIAYGDVYGQKSYYLVSVADKVYLNPEGDMDWKGIGTELMFFKGVLEKLEVEPQIIRHGKFKSAIEPFILSKMSEENRIQTRTFLQGIWNQMTEKISESRGISVEELNKMANDFAIRNAKDALKYKMVDQLVYRDEVIKDLKERSERKDSEKINSISIAKYSKSPSTDKKKLSDPKVAVIYAQGQIDMGDGDNNSIGSEKLSKTIREAREDEKVKAIVLRVNSPGGSALASEVIWRELNLAKQVKPVVVSMGEVAASGGYYISAPANKIFAEPTTITGSIGVFGLMFNAQKMLNNKLGVTIDTVKTNRMSNFGTQARALTSEERDILQQSVEDVYETFITRVSEGRGISKEMVDSIGQGRVWCGTDAKRIGLVDELGGLKEAIAEAIKLANLEKYRIVELPEKKEPFEEFIKELSGEAETRFIKWKLGDEYKLYEHLNQVRKLQGIQTRMIWEYDIN